MSQKLTVTQIDSDHTWVEINYYNDTNGQIPLKVDAQRTDVIINDTSKFNVACTRFNIPISAIPILAFPSTNPFGVNLRNTNTNVNFSTQLTFIPTTGNALINAAQEVYSIYNLLDSLNAAFATSYAAFNAAYAGVIPSAPYMIWNPVTLQFSLLTDIAYTTEPVKIGISLSLEERFPGFYMFWNGTYGSANFNDFEFFIQSYNGTNVSSSTVTTSQQTSTPAALLDLDRVVVKTTTIPADKQTLVNYNSNYTAGNQVNNVLSDFLIDHSSIVVPQGQYLHYLPAFPHYYSLKATSSEFIKFDIEVKWLNKLGISNTIYIDPGTTASFQFLFLRKGLTL
jgi:hypothetical protein